MYNKEPMPGSRQAVDVVEHVRVAQLGGKLEGGRRGGTLWTLCVTFIHPTTIRRKFEEAGCLSLLLGLNSRHLRGLTPFGQRKPPETPDKSNSKVVPTVLS